MRLMALEAIYQKPNTSRKHPDHKVYPYLLRGLVIDRPNQVWCADITYIPMAKGFVYLVAVMDWFSREVLAWRVSITLEPISASRRCRTRWHGTAARRFSTPTVRVTGLASSRRYGLSTPTQRGVLGRPDPNTDRPCFASFPGSVGRPRHQAVGFRLTRCM